MSHVPTRSVVFSAALALSAAAEPPRLQVTPPERLGTAPSGLGLAVGEVAPSTVLEEVGGAQRSLGSLYAKGPTLLVFYRGGWCPFCNLQLHELTQLAPALEKRGVQVVAISVDLPSVEAKTRAQHGVPFVLLSDPKLRAHAAFHVVHVAAEAERQALAGFGIELAKFSGETHHSFAVPSIFLVDKHGIIRFAHVDEDFKTRPSGKQLLDVVARLIP
jgi:peroxiredoxin